MYYKYHHLSRFLSCVDIFMKSSMLKASPRIRGSKPQFAIMLQSFSLLCVLSNAVDSALASVFLR